MRIRNSRRRWGGGGRCGIFVLFGLWSQVTLSADSGMLGRGDSGCFSRWLEAGTCDADVADTNRRDAEGRRQGLWIGMGEGGGMRYHGCFKDDMPEGRFVAVHLCSCMLLSYRYHSSSSILIKVVKSFFK